MQYAKVVVGLPVDGPFDYSVPETLAASLQPGSRVRVVFGTRKTLGYVVGVSKRTSVVAVKPLLAVLDSVALLDSRMLEVTRRLSEYFCCSWGEMIESSLPEALRKGRRLDAVAAGIRTDVPVRDAAGEDITALSDPSGLGRWPVYEERIRQSVAAGRSVICIFSDKKRAAYAQQRLAGCCQPQAELVFRKKPHEIQEWQKIRQAAVSVVCGTRSSIFAPVNNLGLIIVDEEEDAVHKQEQVPHYHPREAACIRAGVEQAAVILCGCALSLEAHHLAVIGRARLQECGWPPGSAAARVRVVDMKDIPSLTKKQGLVIAQVVVDAIAAAVAAGGKVLLFLNRKGFATYAVCRGCGKLMRCQRCSAALTYYFTENTLRCRYCGYSLAAPAICPLCNSGYLYYAGAGTEKAESELARLFPQARLKRIDGLGDADLSAADIFIASEAGVRHGQGLFDAVAVLAVDAMLNKVDLRAGERTFALLTRLRLLCKGQVFLQTNLPQHTVFQALEAGDRRLFYDQEYAERGQLRYPPLRHFIEVKLRGAREERVKACAADLAGRLAAEKLTVTATVAGQPARLRGKFQWEVILSAKDPAACSQRIKKCIKETKHSGIIITANVDPV